MAVSPTAISELVLRELFSFCNRIRPTYSCSFFNRGGLFCSSRKVFFQVEGCMCARSSFSISRNEHQCTNESASYTITAVQYFSEPGFCWWLFLTPKQQLIRNNNQLCVTTANFILRPCSVCARVLLPETNLSIQWSVNLACCILMYRSFN